MKKAHPLGWAFVEIVGVEPTTPCLQSRCSSQLSYTPIFERAFSKKAVNRLLFFWYSVGESNPYCKIENLEY